MTKIWQYRIFGPAMRKELLWVGIIGISLGLIIAFGVWRVNVSLTPKNISTKNTPRPVINDPTFQIVLDKPENNDVVTSGNITVSGITKPLSWITVSGEDDDYIIQSDEQGTVTQDVDLISGVNQIKVTAFDTKGNQSIEKVLVVYSSAFQTKNTSTTSAEARIEEILNKPKAYIGTVTDITDSTIQIKTAESEIKQISTANANVKPADIAIGDFIVAMGYINTSSVLTAQRILITEPVSEPQFSSQIGNLSNIDKKVTISKALKTKLAKIKDTDLIIFVTTVDDKGAVSLRSVFQITKS